jgi:anti-anti-sigma factor
MMDVADRNLASRGPSFRLSFDPEVRVSDEESYALLAAIGDLDHTVASTLAAGICLGQPSECRRSRPHGITFIDSAGLGALIGGIRLIREKGGDVVLFGAQPIIASLLGTTGIDRIVGAYATRDDAVAALTRAATRGIAATSCPDVPRIR